MFRNLVFLAFFIVLNFTTGYAFNITKCTPDSCGPNADCFDDENDPFVKKLGDSYCQCFAGAFRKPPKCYSPCVGCKADEFCIPWTRTCHKGCHSDKSCKFDEFCINGKCEKGCRSHEYCKSNEKCKNNKCVKVCETNEDCEMGLQCSNLKLCLKVCETNDQCGANNICLYKQCVEGCKSNDECGENEICGDIYKCGKKCNSHEECNIFEYCELPEGYCRLPSEEDRGTVEDKMVLKPGGPVPISEACIKTLICG